MASQSINAHWAFYDAPRKNDFLTAVAVAEADDSALRKAREEIRAALRAGLATAHTVVAKSALYEREFVRTARPMPTLRPRFRMQGSFVYRTVNDPAQKPPQEVDLDDGVYMPTEFILIQGNNRPILASKGYFQAVETILAPLCEKKRWQLDTSKSSCVRVSISKTAHIDLPLYAIPSDQFAQMTESLKKSLGEDAALARADSDSLEDEYYNDLPPDQLMLAHRERGWERSDPREIEKWFLRAIDIYGEVLRRLCRYLKAWRDHHWQKSGPSSLAVMTCVVNILDGLRAELSQSRDDVAMLLVSERFADRLNEAIPNPIMPNDPSVALDRDWEPSDRADFVAKARDLHRRLTDALQGTDDPAAVLRQLRLALGSRVTDDTSVIRSQQREEAVKSFPKVAVVTPVVRRTTSG